METLGQELKRRREECKVSMKEVAEATRIGVRFLHAIENDDYNALPGGIYARSFIRAYAKYVNMDEEEAMARYRKQSQQNDEPDEQLPSYQDFATEPSQSSLWVWGVALLLLVVGSAWATLRYIDSRNNVPTTPTPPVAQNSKPEPPPAAANTTAAVIPSATPAVATEAAVNTAAIPPSPVAVPADGFIMSLSAIGESWISVHTDDQPSGTLVTLKAGETREFKATNKLKVTIGNLPGVQVKLNGQPARLPSSTGLVATNVIIQKDNVQTFVAAAANPNAKLEVKKPKPAQPKPVQPTTTAPAGTTGEPAAKPVVTRPPVIAPTGSNTTEATKPAAKLETKPETKPEAKPPAEEKRPE